MKLPYKAFVSKIRSTLKRAKKPPAKVALSTHEAVVGYRRFVLVDPKTGEKAGFLLYNLTKMKPEGRAFTTYLHDNGLRDHTKTIMQHIPDKEFSVYEILNFTLYNPTNFQDRSAINGLLPKLRKPAFIHFELAGHDLRAGRHPLTARHGIRQSYHTTLARYYKRLGFHVEENDYVGWLWVDK